MDNGSFEKVLFIVRSSNCDEVRDEVTGSLGTACAPRNRTTFNARMLCILGNRRSSLNTIELSSSKNTTDSHSPRNLLSRACISDGNPSAQTGRNRSRPDQRRVSLRIENSHGHEVGESCCNFYSSKQLIEMPCGCPMHRRNHDGGAASRAQRD